MYNLDRDFRSINQLTHDERVLVELQKRAGYRTQATRFTPNSWESLWFDLNSHNRRNFKRDFEAYRYEQTGAFSDGWALHLFNLALRAIWRNPEDFIPVKWSAPSVTLVADWLASKFDYDINKSALHPVWKIALDVVQVYESEQDED